MKRTTFLQKMTAYAFLFSLIFAFSTAADAQSKKDRKKAEQLVKTADKTFGQKNYRTAIEQYGEVVKLVPAHAHAHFWKGMSHYYLDELGPALAELDLASAHGYRKPLDIYTVRWRVHYANKNYAAALADIQEGLKLDPENSMLLVGLGDVNMATNSNREALDAYQKASLKVSNSADIYYNIAKINAEIGDAAGQRAAAEEAIKRGTQFIGEAYLLLADAHQKQGNPDEALKAYEKAITAKPDQQAVYRSMAELYRSQNRIDEAIEISRKGLRLFPQDGNLYTDISWYYSLADRHEDAVAAALAGIRFLPDEALGYTNLCRAYNDVKKPDMAITACNNALKLNPNDGETLFYLGRAYDLAKRPEDATKAYKRSVAGLVDFTSKNPTYADGFYLLGNAFFADNQRAKAIEAYKKCLELNPRFVKARYNMGIIQVLEKNKAAALEQYNSLMTQDTGLAAKLKVEIDRL